MRIVIIKSIKPVYTDERGEITDLLNEKINHVGFITTKKGVVRAKHYHKQSTQSSYILKGKFEVIIADPNNLGDREKFILNAGEIIIIPPNTVHAFKALEDSDMIDMISLSREGTGYEDDVVRVDID
jgi:quercetin dioxygenase-like cupin family protein